jgi:phosphate transport system permease protein
MASSDLPMTRHTNTPETLRRSRRAAIVGQSMTWLCGGALALNMLLVLALLGLLAANGLSYFWQRPVVLLTLRDGTQLLGEIHQQEAIPQADDLKEAPATRIQLKVGNRDLGGSDFVWIDDLDIVERAYPEHAVMLERQEWGNFYGFAVALHTDTGAQDVSGDQFWPALTDVHRKTEVEREAIHDLEQGEIGNVNYELEHIRLAEKRLAIADLTPQQRSQQADDLAHRRESAEATYRELADRLFAMRDAVLTDQLVLQAADGQEIRVAVGDIVRVVRPNELGGFTRLRLYASRVAEFIFADPRESNTEGGVFPALFGTVMMVFIMSFAVTPLGVLAALYLREYAKQGVLVQTVRIAVNNLAGVPSIVFGIFGLGFFVYMIGGTIDELFYPEALPTPTYGTGGILWASLTLALLTVPVVIVATEEGLAAVPRNIREGSLALGATKFETIWRVVLPASAPAILTGMILAMARAAGEVAPLMIVGMVKLAPTLPIDHHLPFVHLERKFMHLGFHIYDLGFQSPNVDATTPLVFATALLLVAVVTVMNLGAIVIRNYLRRRYAASPF